MKTRGGKIAHRAPSLTKEQNKNKFIAINRLASTPMADITYYVALPFLQDDSGSLAAGAAEECQSASGAIRRAELLSRAPGSIGALAFSRTGDPMIGEFGDAQVIRAFGEVPSDLSAL
jgi:hypothetical protein